MGAVSVSRSLPLCWTAMVTSQSGESAEVLRWFAEERAPRDSFGLTMEPTSSLANLVPCLIGAGGSEIPFAATRSLTVTLALHAAVLQHLGADLSPVFATLQIRQRQMQVRSAARLGR